MHDPPPREDLLRFGLSPTQADACSLRVQELLGRHPQAARSPLEQDRLWADFRDELLRPARPPLPFALHRRLYDLAYAGRSPRDNPPAAWTPTHKEIQQSNVGQFWTELGLQDYPHLHRWSVEHREEFWARALDRVGIRFFRKPDRILRSGGDVTRPDWLPGASLNIADSCFQAPPERTALVYEQEGTPGRLTWSYGDLERWTRRVAHGLDTLGLGERDPVALYLPMTPESIALYLGVIRSGRPVVGIADTSAPPDLANKLRISRARLLVTTDGYTRGGKWLDIYGKVVEAQAPPAIVVPAHGEARAPLRSGDKTWEAFLGPDRPYASRPRAPSDPTNILFSSGTTKDPKAIVWTQTTPIKGIVDAYFHHDVRPGDTLAWPTSFGWMMGPWLTYANLVLGATMAVYNGDPRSRAFGQFVADTGVTMLGLVPKLVQDWHENKQMEDLDWSRIRRFSSTGETSNPDHMHWLMHRAGYKPIIEYCGGTEIGGGYVTSTVAQPNAPSMFSTPTLGLDFILLDESGRPSERGEVGLVPPSIGLSNDLLNYDHHQEYYAGFPRGPHGEVLRRHGDQLERHGAHWRHLGRVKDMINVYGVKTSSEEIRNVLAHPDVVDTKPVAIDVEGTGQHRLVVYAVPRDRAHAASRELGDRLRGHFNQQIKERLNPLLAHVEDVVLVPDLPQAGPGKTLTSEWFRADYRARLATTAASKS